MHAVLAQMRPPVVPLFTFRVHDSPLLSCLPPPGTAAAQTVKGQLFWISNLAALVVEGAMQRVVTHRMDKTEKLLRKLILWKCWFLVYGCVLDSEEIDEVIWGEER